MDVSESSAAMSVIEAEGWSNKTYACNLGKSFLPSNSTDAFACSYCTMRYDFKPASLNADGERHADVAVNKRGEVSVTFQPANGPSSSTGSVGWSTQDTNSASKRSQLFKGNIQQTTKECVLIFDRTTGEFTLERVEAAVRLKKTREARSSEQPCPAPPPTSEAMIKKMRNVTSTTNRTQRPLANGTHVEATHAPTSASASAGPSRSTKRKITSLSDNEDDEDDDRQDGSEGDSGSRDGNGVDESATRHALATMTNTLSCSRLENDLRLSEDSSEDEDADVTVIRSADTSTGAAQLAPRRIEGVQAPRLYGTVHQTETLTDSDSSDSDSE